jgi:hypothetical protein
MSMHQNRSIAEKLAAALPPAQYDAEITEMHHRQKVDAPSGTAVAMGRAVARGRGTTLEQAGMESGRHGHVGPRATGAIGFATLRGGQVDGAIMPAKGELPPEIQPLTEINAARLESGPDFDLHLRRIGDRISQEAGAGGGEAVAKVKGNVEVGTG